METVIYQGGCLCGAVRFRVSGAHTNPCICHCRSCRGAAGAPFVAWATFPTRAFQVTRGELRLHRSSERVRRGFCAACGSALTYAHDARPDELDIATVMLDDPGAIPPEFHLWVSHKLPWVVLEDGLPQYPEWRTGDG